MSEIKKTWITDLFVHDARGIMFSREEQRVSVGCYSIDFEMAEGTELAEIDVCPDLFRDTRERPARMLLIGVTQVMLGPIEKVVIDGRVNSYTRKILFAGPFGVYGFCVTAFGDGEADLALYGDASSEYAQAAQN